MISLNEFFNPDPVLCPFAFNDGKRKQIKKMAEPYSVTYDGGFPAASGVSPFKGGRPFSVHEFNQLAYDSSLGGFYYQIGLPMTFDRIVCEKIGGYPKGAVLKDLSMAFKDNGYNDRAVVRDVVSLQPNNDKNFVKSEDNPEPYVIGSEVDGKVWWRYVDDGRRSGRIVTDLSYKTLLKEFDCRVKEDGSDLGFEWESDTEGWLLISAECQDINAYTGYVNGRGYDWIDGETVVRHVCGIEDMNDSCRLFSEIYRSRNGVGSNRILPTSVGMKHRIAASVTDDALAVKVSVYVLNRAE